MKENLPGKTNMPRSAAQQLTPIAAAVGLMVLGMSYSAHAQAQSQPTSAAAKKDAEEMQTVQVQGIRAAL